MQIRSFLAGIVSHGQKEDPQLLPAFGIFQRCNHETMSLGPIMVIHLLDDGHIRRWVFEVKGREIILQRYHYERQEGTGHRLIEFFDAEDEGGYGSWTWLEEHEVPWDDELKGEVAYAVVSKLRILKPSERDRRKG